MAKHLTVSGIVQGVGYRYNFQMQARALGLSGWVRNRVDGSVEAVVEGDAVALEKIIAWARQGPPGGRVDELEISEVDASQFKSGSFDILPTA